MQNKRIEKKIAKTNFCKSPVWHGAKIKTKDVRVQTYRGEICDWGFAVRERPTLKACPICGNSRRSGYYRCCPNCIWVFDWQDNVRKLVANAGSVLASHDGILDVSFVNPLVARIRLEIKAYCDNDEVTKQYRNECGRTTAQFEVNIKPRLFGITRNISLSELCKSKDPKKVILDTVLEQFSKVKEEIDNYIDRNGVMKTIAGVPIPVVGGLWK